MKLEIEYKGRMYPLVLDLVAIENIEDEIDAGLIGTIAAFKQDLSGLRIKILRSILYHSVVRGCQLANLVPFEKEEASLALQECGLGRFITLLPELLSKLVPSDMETGEADPEPGKSKFQKDISRMRRAK